MDYWMICRNTTLQYFMHLQFKFDIFEKKSKNRNKLRKYTKKSKLAQILKLSSKQCIVAPQKIGLKNQKKIAEGLARGPRQRI